MDNVWFSRQPITNSGVTRTELVAWIGSEHPDGTVVDSDSPGGRQRLGTVLAEPGSILSIRVDGRVAPHAPRLWYVTLPEPDANPPAVNLVAFQTPHLAEGTVIPADQFTSLPVRSTEQVAALRWLRDTGQVHQIYVAPTHRRRGIGTKVSIAGGLYAAAWGWARIWGGSERTDLGEAFVTRIELFQRRVRPRTRVLPPMTPGAADAPGTPVTGTSRQPTVSG